MVTQPSWLVMLYLAADDLPKDNLRRDTLEDNCVRLLEGIRAIERIDPTVKIVALFDNNARPDERRTETARQYYPSIWSLEVVSSESGKRRLEWRDAAVGNPTLNELFAGEQYARECDTGDFRTLSIFVDWALNYYQHTYSMLAIVGHGGGWAPTIDTAHVELSDILLRIKILQDKVSLFRQHGRLTRSLTPGEVQDDVAGDGEWQKKGWSPGLTGLAPDYTSNSAISTQELRLALELALRSEDGTTIDKKIDVLFLDACLMSMVEVAYELRECASQLIAGQNLLWALLPYRRYFEENNELHLPDTPDDLAYGLVQNYNKDGTQKSWELSAIRTSGLQGLAKVISDLAEVLQSMLRADESGQLLDCIFDAYAACQKFDYDCDFNIEQATEGYVDLYDFADKLIAQLSTMGVGDQAIALAGAIRQLIGDQARTVATIQDDDTKTIIARAAAPSPHDAAVILSALAQTELGDRTERGEVKMSLQNAHGLSIYLPLGEEERHNQYAADLLAKRTLLEYYSDPTQLRFTRDYSQWAALVRLLIELDSRRSHPRRRGQDASLPNYTTPRQR